MVNASRVLVLVHGWNVNKPNERVMATTPIYAEAQCLLASAGLLISFIGLGVAVSRSGEVRLGSTVEKI